MFFFVNGEATVDLGDDVQEAQARIWGHMPAGLMHSIKSKTLVDMVGGLATTATFVIAKAIGKQNSFIRQNLPMRAGYNEVP